MQMSLSDEACQGEEGEHLAILKGNPIQRIVYNDLHNNQPKNYGAATPTTTGLILPFSLIRLGDFLLACLKEATKLIKYVILFTCQVH